MSSVLRSFSQIPVRAKYLLAMMAGATPSPSTAISEASAFTLVPGSFINMSSVATEADIVDLSPVVITDISGGLFKDLGRQVTVYDPATHKHLAVFRQVQRVAGSGSEGVGLSGLVPETYLANIYMKVWAADGNGVVVMRTA